MSGHNAGGLEDRSPRRDAHPQPVAGAHGFVPFARAEVEQSIPQRFLHICRTHARRISVKSPNHTLTYNDLACWSATLASLLRRTPGEHTAPVVLCLPADAPFLAALMGTLLSGQVYVPLDPSFPPAHCRQAVLDTGATVVLTDTQHAAVVRDWAPEGVVIVNVEEVAAAEPLTQTPALAPSAPAAVLFTSGSTGVPRGVALSHRALLHNARSYTNAVGLGCEDRMTLLSSPATAAAATALFGALLNGATLYPFRVREAGLTALSNWLAAEAITVYHSIPTLFRRWAGSLSGPHPFPHLRLLKLGGEPLTLRDVELYRRHFAPPCLLVNGLGLTEACGNVCHFFIDHATDLGPGPLPVGYAVEGKELHVLGSDGRATSAGEVGEIAVSSAFLASGVWQVGSGENLCRPLSHEGNGQFYRTGDLGCLSSDGCLWHLGRKDHLVKVGGYRVQLAEIKAALLGLGTLCEAEVIAKQNEAGDCELVAYLVSARNPAPQPELLRRALAETLPAHAIPTVFVLLDRLPQLAGGKVDREALAALSCPTKPRTTAGAVLPRDALELQLRPLWERTLGVEGVGVTDDFFNLGGTSLSAASLFAQVHAVLGVDLPPATLVRAPTIETLALVVRGAGWTEARSPLVTLQAGRGGPPLYCVPGAGSDVLALTDLARHLGPDQCFVGLQPPGLDDLHDSPRTVELMASYHLRNVRARQPYGPYYLAGTSFGGVVAFEMARQLQDADEEVALLALLDSHGTNFPRLRRWLGPLQWVKLLLRWLLPVGKKEELTKANFQRGIRERLDRLRADLDVLVFARGSPRPYLLRFIYQQQISFRARRRYVPVRPFRGQVHLFRVAEQPPADLFEPDPELGWHGQATEGLVLHPLPGRHGLHIREPNVRILAQGLLRLLAEARTRHREASSSIRAA